MTRLAGSFAKLDRADEHIDALYEEVQRWRLEKPEPYSLTHKDNPEKTERSYHIKIDRPPDLIGWGVQIGDVVHNLRSALDHIAWQCAGGHGFAPDWTEFPIFKDEAAYLSTSRGGGLNKISGVLDTNHRALFEKCQPWRNPNGHDKDALWMLHEFNRVDKHRVLTPILFVPLQMTGKVLVTYPSKEAADAADEASPPLIINPPRAPIYEGAEVFRIVTSAPFVEMEVDQRLDLGASLEYGDTTTHRGGVSFLLRKLAKSARGIAKQFRDAGV